MAETPPFLPHPVSPPDPSALTEADASVVQEVAPRRWQPQPATPPPATAPNPSAEVTALVLTLMVQDRNPYRISVPRGARVLLGRDPSYSPYADFLGLFDAVSRRHASLGLDEDGTAWLQDEYATNRTRVDFGELLPGGRAVLQDGAMIQLCAAVGGDLRFERGPTHA